MMPSSDDLFRTAALEFSQFGDRHEIVHSGVTGAVRCAPAGSLNPAWSGSAFRRHKGPLFLDDIAGEDGSSLGRLGRRLRAALDRLPAWWTGRARSRSLPGAPELELAQFFVSRSQLVTRIQGAGSGPAQGRIRTVMVPTRNRPDELRRCLTSYRANHRRFARDVRYLVVDDSTNADAAAATRRVTALFRTDGARVGFAGRKERMQYAQRLARRAQVPPEVVDFALFGAEGIGYTPGATRNAALLDAAGGLALFVDDDTVCDPRSAWPPARWSSPRLDLGLESRGEPRARAYFGSRWQARAFAEPVECDVLEAHERLLGRTVGECAAVTAPHALELDHISDEMLIALWRGRGDVRVTMNGVAGHSGVKWPHWNLFLPDEGSRRQLLVTEDAYEAGFLSREMVAQVPYPIISSSPFCSSMFLGLDLRRLLPPFMPVLGSEDLLFGRLVRRVFDDAYLGHLPLVLLHDPSDERILDKQLLWDSVRLETNTLIGEVMESCLRGIVSGDEGARLRSVGRRVRELAAAQRSDFEAVARLSAVRVLSARTQQLEDLLQASKGQPSFWARDASAYLRMLHLALEDPHCGRPIDLSAFGARALGIAQQLLSRYAALLEAWPCLVRTAGELAQQGAGLERCEES
jgi:hypothetical protein